LSVTSETATVNPLRRWAFTDLTALRGGLTLRRLAGVHRSTRRGGSHQQPVGLVLSMSSQ
jgi:hypothetical protein